jgi:hypothetical protein
MTLVGRIEIVIGGLTQAFDDLRQAGQRDQHRCIGNLRTFVEKDGGIFLAQYLFDAILIVETGDPDLRSVLQREIALRPVSRKRVVGKLKRNTFGSVSSAIAPRAALACSRRMA